jgi:hypothetical protein
MMPFDAIMPGMSEESLESPLPGQTLKRDVSLRST